MADEIAKALQLLQALRESYAKGVPEKVSALRAAAERLGTDASAAEELQHLVHRLAGSAAIYKFELMGQAARRLEVFMQAYVRGEVGVGSDIRAEVGRLLDEIAAQATPPAGGAADGSDQGLTGGRPREVS